MSPDRDVTLARRRATAQWLDGGAHDAVDVVRRLLAVQAQDLRSVPLALHARGARGGFGARSDAADAGLVAAWLLRGTLHVVAVEDHGWLLALTGHLAERTARRRLAQLGVAEAAAKVVVGALDSGPLSRPQVVAALEAAAVRADGQRTPHLLALAAARGQLVLGLDGRYRRASPPRATVDRDAALAELARRYLRGHAPADDRDLAAWSGLPLRDARAGLAAAGGAPAAGAPPAALPPRLLPAFDPFLLGWRDRSFAVAPEHARAVHPGGGVIRATMVADGRVVGTWRRDRGRIALEPFAPLPPDVTDAFEGQGGGPGSL